MLAFVWLNTDKKLSTSNISSLVIYWYHYYILHWIAHVDGSNPGGKQHETLNGDVTKSPITSDTYLSNVQLNVLLWASFDFHVSLPDVTFNIHNGFFVNTETAIGEKN